MAAYCHNSQVSQLIRERREEQQRDPLKLQREQDTECHKMHFEQFARLAFDADVPQFAEDLFQHLTTLSLRDTLRRGSAALPT